MMFQEVTPAVNPWMVPNVLVPLSLAAVAFIAWLVRLEYKTNGNTTRQSDFELAIAADLKEAQAKFAEHLKSVIEEMKEERAEHREWKKAFYAHATDTKLHHNEEMFKEFRSGIDRRFSGVESTLGDINRKLDHLGDRE